MLTLLFLTSLLAGFQNEPKEHIIESEILGYELRYWVSVPTGYEDNQLPVLYVTDGRGYRDTGQIERTLTEVDRQKQSKTAYHRFC